MKILIDKALFKLYPTAEWILRGEDYDGLEWLDKNISKPSREELETETANLQKEWDNTEYQRQRAPEYPSAQELADALYWQSKGDNSKMAAYITACEAVKAKYPKP